MRITDKWLFQQVASPNEWHAMPKETSYNENQQKSVSLSNAHHHVQKSRNCDTWNTWSRNQALTHLTHSHIGLGRGCGSHANQCTTDAIDFGGGKSHKYVNSIIRCARRQRLILYIHPGSFMPHRSQCVDSGESGILCDAKAILHRYWLWKAFWHTN